MPRQKKKTWAQRRGIPVVKPGSRINGVDIQESNRVSTFEFRKAGIKTLGKFARRSFTDTGKKAALVGIAYGPHKVKYVVYRKTIETIIEEIAFLY